MAYTSSNQWVLIGATSSGIGCARANYAGTYTRIAAFKDWINQTTTGQYFTPNSISLTSATSEIDSTAKCVGSIHYVSILLLVCLQTIFRFI